ncbi:MAG: TatD family hydrolase [Candidatus Sumerlaeia bacterium]|nr:TatD family hydrolase [Candidatus Sumerlaeia bacterium]
MIVDTHAHLTHGKFAGDLSQVLDRAMASGVNAVISIGDTVASSERAVEQSLADSRLFSTAGIHPHHAKEWGPEAQTVLRRLITSHRPPGQPVNRLVAVGEIGLDYHYDLAPREAQVEAFRAQIALALEVDLPIVVHCRKSKDDIVHTLEQMQSGRLRGVVHCFTEDLATAQRLVDLGFHLGFGGIVTHRASESLRAVLRAIGLARVILETDAPYLAPLPHRGKRNEPAFTRDTAAFIAELLGLSLEDVARATTRNAIELFRLPIAA